MVYVCGVGASIHACVCSMVCMCGVCGCSVCVYMCVGVCGNYLGTYNVK